MLSKEFSFELITQDDKARLGKIYTPRGIIDTPAFMPVGTQGTIKGIFNDDIKNKNTNYIRKYLSFITKTWNRNTRKFNGLYIL